MEIEIQRLQRLYGEGRGLLPLSLEINRGECVAVVGHNGAGKSTLLKILATWLVPTSGQAAIGGTSIRRRLEIVRKVGFVPETPCLFEAFSVEYNLTFFGRCFGVPASRVHAIVQEFDLEKFRRSKVQSLSKGLKQRVSLGRSLLADPDLLLLDEPTSGLDYGMTREMHARIKLIHSTGKTVLFTSHRPEEVRALASRLIVLHAGAVVFDGLPGDYFTSENYETLFQ